MVIFNKSDKTPKALRLVLKKKVKHDIMKLIYVEQVRYIKPYDSSISTQFPVLLFRL